MKKIFTFIALVLMISCGNKEPKKKDLSYMNPRSTGRINHVVVVVAPDVWKGKVGEAFREVTTVPIAGLPQEEYPFNISTIPPSAFNKMFENSRNLLVLQISDKETFKLSLDTYAQPQTILEVKSTSEEALVALIHKEASAIVNTFRDHDIKSMQKEHVANKYLKKIKTLTNLNVSMDVPKKYRMVMDTLNSFVWMRSHIAGGIASGDQTNNIIAYEVRMFDKTKPVLAQIINNRDRIGKRFIRGYDEENMYMITEAARKPLVKIVNINGNKAFETRGTWEIFGAFNAGPFLNYSIVDEKNNRVVVVEGFNYAPSVNKRDFVFELEAILKTAKIKNAF